MPEIINLTKSYDYDQKVMSLITNQTNFKMESTLQNIYLSWLIKWCYGDSGDLQFFTIEFVHLC